MKTTNLDMGWGRYIAGLTVLCTANYASHYTWNHWWSGVLYGAVVAAGLTMLKIKHPLDRDNQSSQD